VSGVLLGVSAPICDPRDKRALHVSSGAIAVDMESHVVAAVGAAHGLPVAAMRVVTDPAERALPASAVAAMRRNGTTNIGAMIKAVLMRPREVPALFQTALDALAARATLVQGRRLLGPGLLLVNSLEQLGVPVKLAIGLDPTSRMTTTGHVDRYINYYIANGFGDPVDKGQSFSRVLQNVDLEHMSNVSHFNIDKNNVLQGMVIKDILAAASAGPPQAQERL
jgi:hypothetical protein